MFQVINTSGLPGYSTDSPAVCITHTFNQEHAADLLRQAVRKWGPDWVRSVLGPYQADGGEGLWFVSVDGRNAPTRPHKDLAAARREADRLAKVCAPATVRVLRQEVKLESRAGEVTIREVL